jgi:hypothetical protein
VEGEIMFLRKLQESIAASMQPTKVVRNKEGLPVEIFEKGDDSGMRSFLFADMMHNGGIWMPRVFVKVFESRTETKPVLIKESYMSKNDFANCGLTKDSTDQDKIEKYKDYIKKQKEKYRAQMQQIFNEAERELEALKKHVVSPENDGSISPHTVGVIKDFIFHPNETHTKNLLMDMKDKGYLKPMQRGERKGQLLTDMKAINRVVLNNKLMITPSGISALIAKDLADKLLQWTRWGFSAHLIADIHHWAGKVAEQYHFSEDEKKEFTSKANKAVELYSKEIYKIVTIFNQKLKEEGGSDSFNQNVNAKYQCVQSM